MEATRFLRKMHTDQKIRFKQILSTRDATEAGRLWSELQPVLNLHEQIEDTYLYGPISKQMGPGTPLGDWAVVHDTEVAEVKAVLGDLDGAEAGSPAWRMTLSKVHDMLHKHIMEEELEVFPRVDQAWSPDTSARVGQEMQTMLERGSSENPIMAAIDRTPIGTMLGHDQPDSGEAERSNPTPTRASA